MMKLEFRKMHGLGNDFIIIDGRSENVQLDKTQIRFLCERRTGIGCDQLVIMNKAKPGGDIALEIFNADGQEVQACGNASRCVAWLLMNETGKNIVKLETASGVLECTRQNNAVCIDMGVPRFQWSEIPLAYQADSTALQLDIKGWDHTGICVNTGNPHIVFFVNDLDKIDIGTLGPKVENHPVFEQKTNVEFARVISPGHIRMRVWERGVGITRACGTGACATAAAAIKQELAHREVTIELDGGNLDISWSRSNNHIYMSGPVSYVFDGIIEID